VSLKCFCRFLSPTPPPTPPTTPVTGWLRVKKGLKSIRVAYGVPPLHHPHHLSAAPPGRPQPSFSPTCPLKSQNSKGRWCDRRFVAPFPFPSIYLKFSLFPYVPPTSRLWRRNLRFFFGPKGFLVFRGFRLGLFPRSGSPLVALGTPGVSLQSF